MNIQYNGKISHLVFSCIIIFIICFFILQYSCIISVILNLYSDLFIII